MKKTRIIAFDVRKEELPYFKEMMEDTRIELVATHPFPLTIENADMYLSDIDAVITLTATKVTRELGVKLKAHGVKVIGTRSAGMDHMDLEALEELGIEAQNVSSYSPQAIAELALYFVLMGSRFFYEVQNNVRALKFAQTKRIGHQVSTQTIGIYGFGHIGRMLARLVKPLGATIVAYVNPAFSLPEAEDGVEFITDETAFLSRVDIVSFHIPLTDQTHHMINKAFIAKMKDDAIIVNTARGGIAHTEDILDALDNGELGFYATDVYEQEAPYFYKDYEDIAEIDDPIFVRLLEHPLTEVATHIAYNTYTSIENMVKFSIENAIEYLK